MKCTNCGASLMDTDQFCPECGARVIREKRCPECGALLREGTKFCHKCGSLVAANGENGHKAPQETLDIPIDAIERNILSETAAEIRSDRRPASAPRPKVSQEAAPAKRTGEKADSSHEKTAKPKSAGGKSANAKNAAVHSPAKKNAAANKKPRYRDEDWEDDEDWDEDDYDDEEEGMDIITVMTVIIGCVILIIAVILGYHMYQRYIPKNYGQETEESQNTEDEEGAQEVEQNLEASGTETFTVTITHNVNVRDNPSTTGTNILKVAKEGETYTGIGRTDGDEWYEILLEDGTSGYVFHEYVTVE